MSGNQQSVICSTIHDYGVAQIIILGVARIGPQIVVSGKQEIGVYDRSDYHNNI